MCLIAVEVSGRIQRMYSIYFLYEIWKASDSKSLFKEFWLHNLFYMVSLLRIPFTPHLSENIHEHLKCHQEWINKGRSEFGWLPGIRNLTFSHSQYDKNLLPTKVFWCRGVVRSSEQNCLKTLHTPVSFILELAKQADPSTAVRMEQQKQVPWNLGRKKTKISPGPSLDG